MTQPACPECDKLVKIAPQSNVIGEFLDWLESEKEIILAIYDDDELFPDNENKESLLAEFFEIDLNLIEKERQALLEHIRENS